LIKKKWHKYEKTFFFLFSIVLTQQLFSQSRAENFRMILHDDWRMQSSLINKATGDQISKKDFSVNDWYKITVPSTFVAGLLANHEYNFDPFYSKNFEKLADKRMGYHLVVQKGICPAFF
jgi:exo-1,4-beta-D-glucosaminidase